MVTIGLPSGADGHNGRKRRQRGGVKVLELLVTVKWSITLTNVPRLVVLDKFLEENEYGSIQMDEANRLSSPLKMFFLLFLFHFLESDIEHYILGCRSGLPPLKT